MEESSCPETEDKFKSEDEDDYTPVPHGTVSSKVIPGDTMNKLVHRVCGNREDSIVVHKDKVDAVEVIMTQLSLKQGLKSWGK